MITLFETAFNDGNTRGRQEICWWGHGTSPKPDAAEPKPTTRTPRSNDDATAQKLGFEGGTIEETDALQPVRAYARPDLEPRTVS